ncbi:hypothetical protein JCM8097_009284 [Rhodosporidiobolus ruineniae]
MATPLKTHPLQTAHEGNSSGSLPTPPRSPALGASAPAPFDHGDAASAIVDNDLESLPPLVETTSADPLMLRSRLLTGDAMAEMRKRKKGKGVFDYHERQDAHIEDLLKHIDDHVRDAEEEEGASRMTVKIAIYASLICNCILATLQLYAAIASQSLSIFATASDSVFDPAANLILWWCHKRAESADRHKYPSGGVKMESVGDIVYANIMLGVSVILIAFSIQDLATKNTDKELHIPSLVVVGIAFAVKFGLFLYCWSVRGQNSQVRVLWEDHRNDLFVNGFGIFTSAAGAKIAWWFDPTGAMIISVCLIYSWARTSAHHFKQLAGVAAPLEFTNLVTYKAMTFASDIEAIDSVCAYHNGPVIWVEVDLVMKKETTLEIAHDVSQALQDKLEELPQVGRAFVHVDYETSHKPEHVKRK